jgi:hypothetical protein
MLNRVYLLLLCLFNILRGIAVTSAKKLYFWKQSILLLSCFLSMKVVEKLLKRSSKIMPKLRCTGEQVQEL